MYTSNDFFYERAKNAKCFFNFELLDFLLSNFENLKINVLNYLELRINTYHSIINHFIKLCNLLLNSKQ